MCGSSPPQRAAGGHTPSMVMSPWLAEEKSGFALKPALTGTEQLRLEGMSGSCLHQPLLKDYYPYIKCIKGALG